MLVQEPTEVGVVIKAEIFEDLRAWTDLSDLLQAARLTRISCCMCSLSK